MRSIERNDREIWVEEIWDRIMPDGLFGLGTGREWRQENCFREILIAYNEVQRRYHNFDHIVYGLEIIEKHRTSLKDPDAVILAYIYHDVVYDPGQHDNEERSVVFMRRQLESIGVYSSLITKVGRYILYTKHTGKFLQELDARFLIDVDLAQFSVSFEVFNRNTEKIAAEYAYGGVSRSDFNVGRAKFFEAMLARPQIYQSKFFKDKEKKARWNLEHALDLKKK